MDNKRSRGKNFTERDKQTLLEIVGQYKSVVENKKTDSVNTKNKFDAWGEISIKFNACNDSNRTPQQLKTFYDNYKAKLKKNIAYENIQEYSLSTADKETLVNLLEKYKGITPHENLMWSAITDAFNKNAIQKRSELYLRNVYEKHIKNLKKDLVSDKVERKKTGGGPNKKRKVSDNDERLIFEEELMDQFTPLQNPYDSSATFFKDVPTSPPGQERNSPELPEDLPDAKRGNLVEVPATVNAVEVPATANASSSFVENNELNAITSNDQRAPVQQTRKRAASRWTKPSDAYSSIVNSNTSKTNLNLKKEEFIEKSNKMKLEILELELNTKKRECEEKLNIILIEKQIKLKELKLLELKIQQEEEALKKVRCASEYI